MSSFEIAGGVLDGNVEFVLAISQVQDILKKIRDKSRHRADLIKILRLLLQLKSLCEDLAIIDQFNQPPLLNFLEAHLIECITSVIQLRKRLSKNTIVDERMILDPLDATSRKSLERLSRIKDFLLLAVDGDSSTLLPVLEEDLSNEGSYNALGSIEGVEKQNELGKQLTGATLNDEDFLQRPAEIHWAQPRGTMSLQSNDSIKLKQGHDEAVLKSRICQWLSPVNISSIHHFYIEKHYPGTGEWFLSSEQYADWQQGQPSFVWLDGIPGSGKTILCSTIIEATIQYCANNENASLAYFYFSFADIQRQRVSSFAQSILAQLIFQRTVPEIAIELFEKYQFTKPPLSKVIEALSHVIQDSKATFLIVDAVDECSTNQRNLLCQQLLALQHNGNLRIFITGRREADINMALSKSGSVQMMQMNRQAIDGDIGAYVQGQITQNLRFNRWPSEVKKEIVDVLAKGSQGIFRWAICQLNSFSKCLTVKAIRESLRTLPATLDETYIRMLSGIDKEYHTMTLSAFIWLAFSTRPLSVYELAEAVVIDPKKCFDVANRLPSPFDILNVLSDFLSVQEVSKSDFESLSVAASSDLVSSDILRRSKADRTTIRDTTSVPLVRFSHMSVREFFLSDGFSLSGVKRLHISALMAQSWICQSAIRYIDFHARLQIASLDSIAATMKVAPLLQYTCSNWDQHAKACDRLDRHNGYDRPLSFTVSKLCDALSSPSWVTTWLKFSASHTLKQVPVTKSPLLYAAQLGLRNISFRLLESDDFVEGANSVTADILCAAVISEDTVMVEHALNRMGASLDAIGSEGKSPLYVACERALFDVVKFLHKNGASLDQVLVQHGSMLHGAIRGGHIDIVDFLVNIGIDVNLNHENDYGPPLQLAATSGNLNLVRYLMDHGADINAQGGLYKTALQAAVWAGDSKIVHLLLDRGADINVKGGVFGSALHAAAWKNSEDMVRLLVERGADIDFRGQESLDPIWFIFSRGSEDLVGLILDEAPASVVSRAFGNTFMGAFSDSENLLEDLMKLAADISIPEVINPENSRHRIRRGNLRLLKLHEDGRNLAGAGSSLSESSLMALTEMGSVGTLQLLFLHCTQISPRKWRSMSPGPLGGSGGSPSMNFLARVFNYGIDGTDNPPCRNDVLATLIAAGQQWYHETGREFCPLDIATIRGSSASVKQLLDAGADFNATDPSGSCAIHHAAFHGHHEILQLLLDAGADMNAQKRDGRTALHMASMTDQLPASSILIERGAHLEVKDKSGMTPLQIAASRGNLPLLQKLIIHRADPEFKTSEGCIPLHIAV